MKGRSGREARSRGDPLRGHVRTGVLSLGRGRRGVAGPAANGGLLAGRSTKPWTAASARRRRAKGGARAQRGEARPLMPCGASRRSCGSAARLPKVGQMPVAVLPATSGRADLAPSSISTTAPERASWAGSPPWRGGDRLSRTGIPSSSSGAAPAWSTRRAIATRTSRSAPAASDSSSRRRPCAVHEGRFRGEGGATACSRGGADEFPRRARAEPRRRVRSDHAPPRVATSDGWARRAPRNDQPSAWPRSVLRSRLGTFAEALSPCPAA